MNMAKKRLTKDRRDEEVIDMAGRIADMAENFASDVAVATGVPYEYAHKIAWQGVRLALKDRREVEHR